MKTYTETQRKKKFNWFDWLKRLESIQDIKECSLAGIRYKNDLARRWVTCAVGNQCEIIPRLRDGTPEDRELWDLGHSFSEIIAGIEHAVLARDFQYMKDNVELALSTLHKIEERSAEIIAQMEDGSVRG